MLTDPFDPARTLIEVADLDSGAGLSTARTVVEWAREYLSTGHPELGRRGHVCPFAKTALDGGTFYVSVQPGTPERVEDVAETLLGYRDWFTRLSSKDGSRAQWNTILVAFPDLVGDHVRRVIDGTQHLLKAEYVARGLMIGEFHDGPPDKGGLWNPAFRPLRSPVPLLAIRNMVPTDFPFLQDDPEFVAAYLSRFSDEVPAHLREHVADAVAKFGLTPAPQPVGEPVALTPAQRRLWFLSRMDPGNAVHNIARAFRLTGAEPSGLGESLAAIVRRHPALRITLAEQDGQPVATVADNVESPLAVLDVSDEVEAERAARRFARRPFDIRRGPLLRGLLLRLSPQDHVFVLAAHRIAADDAVMDLICDEFSGITGNVMAPADRVSLPSDLAYWTRRLAGAPTLDLPTDRRRPPAQSYRGATHRFHLDGYEARLPQLLAVFNVVLSRHSGQSDILVGVAGDTTVVLRTDLSGNPTLQQLVASCTADLSEASRHASVAFEDVVAALDVERNLGAPPVFQAGLAVRETPPVVPRLPGVTAAEFPLDLDATDIDLTLRAWPGADGLELALEYNTDLYEPSTIRRLADHLIAVATADVSTPVNEIPLLSSQERAALLLDRQGVTIELPDPATPLTLLAQGLARDPDAVVVRASDGDLSYADLYRRASQLAHLLRAWGAGPDVPVGVCVERSASMVVALLGVWFAGAAYVPLDPGFPIDRLRLMLADAGAEVVVTHGPARERVDDLLAETAGVINLDDDADVLADQPDMPPDDGPRPDDLAYVIYTSGSTGRPKGVEIPHRAVANLLVAFDRVLPLSNDDRWLAVTTLSFDIAVLELFHPLASGAQVVVASRPETEDGLLLRQRAISSGATVMQSTPATWRMLLAAGGVPPGIRTRLCGGEAVPRDLADELAVDGATVWNVYGPTETTVWSAAGVIVADAPIQIGPPIANTTVDVLDASGSPVPVGVVGEVHIGGLGLARGYRNMPALTGERFIADPARPGSRLYATGDLARYRPGGLLEFLGRADQQVKVRGFRIELGEIESALRAHSSVDAAVVTTWRGEGDDHRLVAYLVGDVSWPDLEASLRRSLPGYMVPSAVVTLDELPLTPNGKVDRAALPSPEWGGQIAERRAPGNAIERALVELWRDVLGVADVGVDDDFFSLGGHSLLGARLLARVRAYFDIEVSVRSLFEAPTAAGLAAVLERLEPEPGYAEAMADSDFRQPGKRSVPRRGPEAVIPLSSAQRRLWFLDRLAQDNAAYVMSMTHRITGELDVPALTGALQAVIARHEALRARIVDAGEPVLVIADAAEAPLSRHQVADEAEMLALVAAETSRPIATDQVPMLRASLITLPDDQHVLVLCVHHIVCDDLSLNVLNQDLTAAYNAIVSGQPAAADEPAARFGDYLVWLHSQTRGDPGYWVSHLKDAPALLELPTDRHRPPVRRFRGDSVPAKISADLSDGVRELARRTETTPFMVLLAAFSVLLARYSDSSDIVIGAPVANRTLPELEDVVGMFVNTIALRADLSGDPTLGDVLAMAREITVAGLGHADVPLDEVIDLVNPPRDLGYNPLFQVMLVVNPAGRPLDTPGLRMQAEGLAETPARFDLTLVATDAPDGLRAHFDFDADLFDRSTVDSMGYALRRILGAMMDSPDQRAWEVDVASPVRAVAFDPPASLVHDLIAAQASRTPEALAVTGDGAAITYAELDRKANQLAWRLRALGVGPDVLVGLGLRAGVDAIVGILGILRAGGAYLPLDPEYPQSRLDFLLADSGASVVVTSLAHRSTFPDGVFLDSLADGSDAPPPVEVGPSHLAYVIYTSGSTGEPKGVQVPHSALANLAVAFRDLHGFGPATRLLMVPPVSFDASAGDVFPALISGATLITVRSPASLTTDVLRSLCTSHGVTAVDAPVALWRQWVNDLADFSGLTTMMVGGEQVPRDTLRAWASLTGGKVAFYNHYGPTEATVCALTYRTDDGSELGDSIVPCGFPLPGVRAYVLDRRLRPVPAGVPGELFLAGAGLARGYLGDPARTAAVFLPDPFAGGRMYRTGDLARRRADGRIEFLGRADRQVKIRGHRVEPSEIESIIRQHPDVNEVAVVPHGDPARLIAYIVGSVSAELRSTVAAALPDYLVPNGWVAISSLPLTQHGKVDYSALPDPAASLTRPAHVTPTTDTENVVAQIWARLLEVETVGADDNFFDLGGHSLLAVGLLEEVHSALGVRLTVRALFEAPELAAFAVLVDRACEVAR